MERPVYFRQTSVIIPRAVDGLPEWKVVLLPPVDILLVAKRTDHDRTGPELRVDRLVLHDRDCVTKERHREGFSFQGVIPVIGRVNRDRDAGGKELGPGGRDLDAVEIKEV